MILKLKICGILIFLATAGFGQIGNPFEIWHRLDSLYEYSGSSDPVTEIDTTNIDLPAVQDTIASPVLPPGKALDAANPFEVNHVPIRKSELQKTSVITPNRQIKSENKSSGSSDLLVFGISILSLLLLAIIANVKRSLFTKIFRSFTNDNMLKLTQREENNGLNAGFLILYIIYALNAASLIFLLLGQNRDYSNNIWLFLFLVVIGIYLVRHISMFLIGLIFPIKKETVQYSFLIAVVNILLGIVLIPINLIIAYAPDSLAVAMIYSVIGILGFAFIVRSVKGLLIGLVNYGTHIFHFFLYLCTFEIVPVLLIYRVFSNISV